MIYLHRWMISLLSRNFRPLRPDIYLAFSSIHLFHNEYSSSHVRLKNTGCAWEECARLLENVAYIKVHHSNPKHLYPKLNSYGDNGERKMWSSCGSTYCTCFACCYPHTAHVRPSVSQPSQAHSAFIINRCHSYTEL